MTAIALGDLPSNVPLKTGSMQHIAGASAASTTYNNTVGAGSTFRTVPGGGTNLCITAAPTHDCWWKVTAQVLWISPDGIWTRADWRIILTDAAQSIYKADADGRSQAYGMCVMHSALGFLTSFAEMTYKLVGGQNYGARLEWMSSPFGFNQQLWHDGSYTYLTGHVLGETTV